MRAVLPMSAVAICALAACAEPAHSAGEMPVDNSFQIIDQTIATPQGPGRVLAYVKLQAANGLLAVCGLILADAKSTTLLGDLGNNVSYIEISASPDLKLGTRLLPRYGADLTGRDLAAAIPPAACERTGAAWQDDLARPRLTLHIVPTVLAGKQLRIPSSPR